MPGRQALLGLLIGATLLACGCGEGKPRKKQAGPIKDWIVGDWVRSDDGIAWSFRSDGEMITGGRLPIGGSYGTEEPNKVKVHITGANAITAGMQLGLPVDENQNLYATFLVQDDEMRPAGIKSDVVFRKQ